MDAAAQLALLTKAKQVFEQAGTFLSFPVLTPLTYAPDKLRFGLGAPDLAAFGEFSRFVNLIPRGPLYQPADEDYLWDVYYDVTHTAQVAAGSATPAETAAYEQAKALLNAPGPGGLRMDSPALQAYKQYRDAYTQALINYKAAQATAAASADPAVKARWQSTDEPALRQKIDQAAADWATKGRKADIEAAEQVVNAYGVRNPAGAWDEWRDAYVPDIDRIGDPPFVPTGFAPADIIDHNDWPTFTLSAAEVGQLIAQAPAELKQVLAPPGAASDLDSLTFQYRSVVLIRPWLQPALFTARFWRQPGSAPLCDGGTPPQGRCPAYITAVVFVRNVVEATRGPGGVVHTLPLRGLPPMAVMPAPAPAPGPPVEHGGAPVVPPSHFPSGTPGVPHVHAPSVAAEVGLFHAPGLVAAHVPTFADRAEVRAPALAALAAAPSPAPVPHVSLLAVDRVRASAFTALATAPSAPSAPPAPSPAPPVPASPDISILAFVCKRLPKCPDPDPTLNWVG